MNLWMDAAFNATWIAGLTILLSTLGYVDWLARVSATSRRDSLLDPLTWGLLAGGLGLTSAGWALSQARGWWQIPGCVALAAVCTWQVILSVRRRPGPSR